MTRVAWSVFVFSVFMWFVCVRSQCNTFIGPGWRGYDTNCDVITTQSRPTAAHVSDKTPSVLPSDNNAGLGENRLRREAISDKHPSTAEQQESLKWSHSFEIEHWSKPTEGSEKLLLMNAEILKTSLDAMEIDLLNPTGLRFSFRDDTNTSAVLEFRVKKYLDAFYNYIQDNSIPLVTFFTTSFRKVDGGWSFFVPLKMEPGEEIEYFMSVLFGKEKFRFSVEGTLKIYIERPSVNGSSTELTQFCPTRPLVPVRQTRTSKGVGLSLTVKEGATVGTEGGVFRWNHQFTINDTYEERRSKF